ncbi:hypothetical protein D6T64_05525 [Cryobacterium melibiosiphilum]|uniref:DUF6194 domain-containing protein n=1 Tax=Cryobacterium melibiosiphilum TaxID=995039 RepID=A0A3A5MI21_9MICO|nr:DUF6194 family protein [Cryobacterium melibiosiphilum]RJT89797.1 hypothetical protein D6T64_05525 [Cryobacterium melibiosiphilum]
MNLDQILAAVRAFDGVLELAPGAGSEFAEIAWGDHFFYYAPNGQIPQNVQPYATIVTKDYPGDSASLLDEPGRWRVNVHVGRARFTELVGESPDGFAGGDVSARDFSEPDAILPHPVYGALGWIAVVNPGERTAGTLLDLLRAAHDDERRRTVRRPRPGG